jgi:hypothetical protein
MKMTKSAQSLSAVSRWLDESPAYQGIDPETALWRRCSKVSAEAGEVHDALSGYVGENPRKGVTHTIADIEYELLDVAHAALAAVEHLHGNDESALERFAAHITHVARRAGVLDKENGNG